MLFAARPTGERGGQLGGTPRHTPQPTSGPAGWPTAQNLQPSLPGPRPGATHPHRDPRDRNSGAWTRHHGRCGRGVKAGVHR